MRRLVGWIDRRAWLVGAALGLDLLVVREQVITAIGSAACRERAKFELVLCVAPPAEWQVALAVATALGLALALGALLSATRRRMASPASASRASAARASAARASGPRRHPDARTVSASGRR